MKWHYWINKFFVDKLSPKKPLPTLKPSTPYRIAISLSIAIFFILHTIGWLELPFLQRFEKIFYDFRLRSTLTDLPDPRIVVVTIDEETVQADNHRPWTRENLAHLVDLLFERYRIKLLGFNMVLAEPDTDSRLHLLEQLAEGPLRHDQEFLSTVAELRPLLSHDRLLAKSLANRPIVLGFCINADTGKQPGTGQLPPSITDADDLPFSAALPDAQSVTTNLTLFQQATSASGFINNPAPDPDGVHRKLPLLVRHQNKVYEAFPLALYRMLAGSAPAGYRFNDEKAANQQNLILDTINLGNTAIPVDRQSAVLIPFQGGPGRFQPIPASQILNGDIEPNQLKDKIVILGPPSELLPTPVHSAYPGAEIHANVLSALLEQRFKSRPDYLMVIETFELLAISLIAIILLPQLPILQSSIAFVLIFACLIAGNFFCWLQLSVDTVLAGPLLLLVLLSAIPPSFNFFIERRRKKQISTLFGQYVPPEILAKMGQSDERYSLQGESREMTVLFSDIRGFTSIAESMEPKVLCDLINAVLTPVTRTIHETHGTIDKYIGDAVMAFWGAPMHSTHHASDAICSALKIIQILEKLKLLFIARGWPSIDMGIGINTGFMNVGNMGSQFRMAYTVMGDAVNLGSRLEGLTKHYGVKIIVSETTRKAAPEFFYRELDAVRVKGKQEPIYIYEPLAEKSVIAKEKEEEIYLLQHGLSYYRQQQWQSAQEIFFQLAQGHPDDKLYKLYLERIKHYQRCPPDNHWDGVFTHTEK